MQEAATGQVVLTEIDVDVLKNLSDACYSAWVEINDGNVDKLLGAAPRSRFEEVEKACATFLMKQLSPATCLGIHALAERFTLTALSKAAMALIASNFEVVSASDEFRQLSSEQLAEVLKCDELIVSDEDEVLNALMSWMALDKASRTAEFLALFKFIRFPFLGKSAVVDVLEHFKDVDDHHKSAIVNTIVDCSKPSRADVRPRLCLLRTIFAIGGMSESGLSIEKYERDQNEWKMMKKLPGKRMSSASVFLGNAIIVTGGQDNDALDLVTAIDVNTFEVRALKPMNRKRSAHAAVVLNGEILGGGRKLNSVEKYNPHENEWAFVGPMSSVRYYSNAAVLNDTIFITGGLIGSNVQSSAECYLPGSNQWLSVTPMNVARNAHALVALDGFLYAIGGTGVGLSALSSAERFDPRTNKWEMNSKKLESNYEYDRRKRKTDNLAPMTVARSFFAIVKPN